jgi:hypothetical protein
MFRLGGLAGFLACACLLGWLLACACLLGWLSYRHVFFCHKVLILLSLFSQGFFTNKKESS